MRQEEEEAMSSAMATGSSGRGLRVLKRKGKWRPVYTSGCQAVPPADQTQALLLPSEFLNMTNSTTFYWGPQHRPDPPAPEPSSPTLLSSPCRSGLAHPSGEIAGTS